MIKFRWEMAGVPTLLERTKMYLTPRGSRDTVLESTKFASNLNLTRVKLGCGRTPAGHSKDCGIRVAWALVIAHRLEAH